MAHTNSWDETSPTNALAAANIDDEILKLRVDIRERMAVDHYVASSDSGEALRGCHKKVTFEDDLSDVTITGDQTAIFAKKLASTDIVPYFKNASNTLRMVLGDSNLKKWMYTATAPVTWKATAHAGDMVLVATGGSTYTTPGANAGSWQVSGMTTATVDHNHQWHDYVGTDCLTWNYNGSDTHNVAVTYASGSGLQANCHNAQEKKSTTDHYTKDYSHTHTTTWPSAWRMLGAVTKLYELDMTV